MHTSILTAIALVFVPFLLVGFAPPGASPTTAGQGRMNQQEVGQLDSSPQPPDVTAQAAAVLDTDTGRVLYSYNGEERRLMASTAKMVNVLVAVRYASPDEVATVHSRDLVGGSTAHLVEGEHITIGELLYGAMLPSGNDAAYTIADYVGGKYLGGNSDNDIGVFVQAMNDEVQRMGLKNTHFETPNGFDAPNQYSTAVDLALIGRHLLQNPLLARIVSTPNHTIEGYVGTGDSSQTVRYYLENTNELLTGYPGTNGIKTGTTGGAGEVLVASIRHGHRGLIVVVMGSLDRYSDARALLNWAFSRFTWIPLAEPVFSCPAKVPAGHGAYAAVPEWDDELAICLSGQKGPHYYLGTLPLDPLPLNGSIP